MIFNKSKKKHIFYIFLISLLLFIAHWIFSFLFFDESLITKILFGKKTEGQLFSYIKYLSSMEFNNSYQSDIFNLKNIPIPFGSLFFHSIFFYFFGDIGLILVDYFGILFFLLIFYNIFKNYFGSNYALIYSLFLYILPSIILLFFGNSFTYLTQISNDLYSLRVHRPFPSSLYFFGLILTTSIMYRDSFKNKNIYLISGILLGMQFSSFYYFFITSSLAIFFSFILKFKKETFYYLKLNFKKIILLIITFLLSSIPFIYFLISSENDIKIASGYFSLTTEKKLFILNYFINKIFSIKFIFFNIIIIINIFLINIYFKKFINLINIFFIFYFSSIISPLIFFLISPGSGLIYHFANTILLLGYLNLIIFIFIIFYFLTNNILRANFILIIISLFILSVTVIEYNTQKNKMQDESFQSRIEFQDIINILNQDQKKKYNSLLTFSSTFMNWAIIKERFKNLELVYSTLTPRTFNEIENNIIDSFRFLKLDKKDFINFFKLRIPEDRIYNENVQKFMYMKYTANSLNTFNNSKKFNEDELNLVLITSPMVSKNLLIPDDEFQRLLKKFINNRKKIIEPEVIILDKQNLVYKSIKIDRNKYCLKYSMEIFELYLHNKLGNCK